MIRNQMGAATLVFDALLLVAFPLLFTLHQFVELPERGVRSHQLVRPLMQRITHDRLLSLQKFCTFAPALQKCHFPVKQFS